MATTAAIEERLPHVQTIVSPLLEIVDLPCDVDISSDTSLIFTSVNGVEAHVRHDSGRGYPVYCVGKATADAARAAGFERVMEAEGTGAHLQALIDLKAKEEDRFMHLGGKHVRTRFTDGAGRPVAHKALYEARAVETLNATVLAHLDRISHVMLFSARTAGILTSLIAQHLCMPQARTIRALCLAPSVVDSLASSHWADIRTADHPAENAMIDLLERDIE